MRVVARAWRAAGCVDPVTDEDEQVDLDGTEFAPMDHTAERLAFLALAEAHGLLSLLLTVAQDDGPVSSQADRPACAGDRRTHPVRELTSSATAALKTV